MRQKKSRSAARQTLLAAAIASQISAAGASPYAFISTNALSGADVRIVDITSMTVVASITGIGEEPGRMVANADRSRIYLSSYISPSVGVPARGMVYLIDTSGRRVVRVASVGERINRTIALSPDESKVYTFKQTNDGGNPAIGVAVLDADTLAELAVAPLPTTECLPTAKEVSVHPDGRIFVSGCSDFIRIIDPITLSVSNLVQHPAGTVGRMLGFSPNGAELYVPVGSANVSGNTGLVAIDIASGGSANFFYDLQSSSGSIFPTGSQAARMLTLQRPGDPPNDPTVFFTYTSAAGNSPVVHARSSDLSPASGAPLRRILSRHNVGPTSLLGASVNGTQGIGARLGGMRQMHFSLPGLAPIASAGAVLSLPGVSALSDIIIDDGLFGTGFE